MRDHKIQFLFDKASVEYSDHILNVKQERAPIYFGACKKYDKWNEDFMFKDLRKDDTVLECHCKVDKYKDEGPLKGKWVLFH